MYKGRPSYGNILICCTKAGGVNVATHLVDLMVVLRIILEYLELLLVLECPRQIIGTELLPPLFAINEPVRATWLAPVVEGLVSLSLEGLAI